MRTISCETDCKRTKALLSIDLRRLFLEDRVHKVSQFVQISIGKPNKPVVNRVVRSTRAGQNELRSLSKISYFKSPFRTDNFSSNVVTVV